MASRPTHRRALALLLALAAACALPASAGALPTITGYEVVKGANPGAQHVDGTSVWVRPGTVGSFTLRVTATSPHPDGIDRVEFPPIATGWVPTTLLDVYSPPYEQTYAWSLLSEDPGSPSTAIAWDDEPSSANLVFHIRMDGDGPVGGSLAAHSVATRDSSVPVSGAPGTDAGSGVATWQLRRRTSPIAGDACTAWSTWSSIGPQNPTAPITNALGGEGCYQYGLVAADRVGNETAITQDGWLRVDRTAPAATVDPIPASEVHGGGSVTITGSALDQVTSVRAVSVAVQDRYSICANVPVDPVTGRWSCTWKIDHAERVGPATVQVAAVDRAGNRSHATQAVAILAAPNPFGPRDEDVDRTPPVVGLARMPVVSWTDRVLVRPTAIDDRPGYVDVRMEQQSASASAAGFSEWVPASLESSEVALEQRGETTCFRAVATDALGNTATSFPRCTTLPLDDTDLRTSGRWDELEVRRAWLGTLTRSTRRGSSITLRTADPTPQLVVATCRDCGRIRVLHGTRVVGTWNLRARTTSYRKLLSLGRIERPRSAPLRIVALSDAPVLIDGFVSGR